MHLKNNKYLLFSDRYLFCIPLVVLVNSKGAPIPSKLQFKNKKSFNTNMKTDL